MNIELQWTTEINSHLLVVIENNLFTEISRPLSVFDILYFALLTITEWWTNWAINWCIKLDR